LRRCCEISRVPTPKRENETPYSTDRWPMGTEPQIEPKHRGPVTLNVPPLVFSSMNSLSRPDQELSSSFERQLSS